MKAEITDRVRGYHYTNSKAYRSMQTKGIDGYLTFGFDDFSGFVFD